ncbi:TerB family tellurite resistance protein [Fluviicola sp.]|uniref:TerB family tellurite resistance protein n=1 Tax=Fluviicola sp. TaxID=1917219 RepID=UPI0031DA855C
MKNILTQFKDAYDILNNGYNEIRDISKGDYSQHKSYLDGLLNVSPTVRNYSRVATIIKYQYQLVAENRKAYARFSSSKMFGPQELDYMSRVYNQLLNQSLNNLEELTTILTNGKTRMSDDERLQAIDRIYADMEEKLNFLKAFNNSTGALALQRQRERNDVKSVEKLYGIKY